MMEFCCGRNRDIVKSMLLQISKAIDDICLWNKNVETANDYLIGSEGVKTLAATSMLLEAIGND